MRRVVIVVATMVAAGLGWWAYRHRAEAGGRRELAIRECATWPQQDHDSCVRHVDEGTLASALETAGRDHLSALRDDVTAARRRCTELDAAIGYVALSQQVLAAPAGNPGSPQARERLAQGFDCEDAAVRAQIRFDDAVHTLADKQRAAGFAVTDYGVALPEFETPAIAARKAADERAGR